MNRRTQAIFLAFATAAGAASAQTVQSDLLVSAQISRKLAQDSNARQAAYVLAAGAATDSDGFALPAAPTAGTTLVGGGVIPSASGAPITDGYGVNLGYCAWDNGTVTNHAGYLAGTNDISKVTIAVVSPGNDNVFSTTCAQIYAGTAAQGDDFYVAYTGAQILSGVQGTSYFSDPVATVADLASIAPATLKDGQVRLVKATNQLYKYRTVGGWTTLTGGQWADSAVAGDVNYTAGNVSIGTSTAQRRLTVNSTAVPVSIATTGSRNGIDALDAATNVVNAFFGYDNTANQVHIEAIKAGSALVLSTPGGSVTVSAAGALSAPQGITSGAITATTLTTSGAITTSAIQSSGAMSITSTALTLSAPTTVTGALTASGGISATTGAYSGVLAANGGLTATTGSFSGALAANGGLAATTGTFSGNVSVAGLLTASGGMNLTGGLTANSATITSNGASLTIQSTNATPSQLILKDTGTTNNLIIGSAGQAMTFQTGGAERMLIDGSGYTLFGTDLVSRTASGGQYGALQVKGTTLATSAIQSTLWNAAAGGAQLHLSHGHSGTPGTMTATPSGTQLGAITFGGTNGSAMEYGAYIQAATTQNWTTTAQGTKLDFYVTSNNSTSKNAAMTIDHDGKVSLPTNNALLTVGIAGQAGFNQIWTPGQFGAVEGAFLGTYGTNGGAILDLNTHTTATNSSSWRLAHESDSYLPGNLYFQFAGSQSNRSSFSYANKVLFDSNGSIAIGGTATDLGLRLMSNATDTFTTNGNTVHNYSTGWKTFSDASGAPSAYMSGWNGLRFFATGGERMRITASGQVGIGRTNPTASLDVNGAIVTDSFLVARASGSEGGQLVLGYAGTGAIVGQTAATWNVDVDSSSSLRLIRINASNAVLVPFAINQGTGITYIGDGSFSAGTTAMQVYGTAYATGSFVSSSDARLKHDVRTVTGNDVLGRFMKLRSVNYVMNGDPESKRNYGYIAQELEPLFPDLVSMAPNGYLAVAYQQMLPILTSVVQQQQLALQDLERRKLDNTVDKWLQSSDEKARMFFERDGRTVLRGHGDIAIELRNAEDLRIAAFKRNGSFELPGMIEFTGRGGFAFNPTGTIVSSQTPGEIVLNSTKALRTSLRMQAGDAAGNSTKVFGFLFGDERGIGLSDGDGKALLAGRTVNGASTVNVLATLVVGDGTTSAIQMGSNTALRTGADGVLQVESANGVRFFDPSTKTTLVSIAKDGALEARRFVPTEVVNGYSDCAGKQGSIARDAAGQVMVCTQ